MKTISPGTECIGVPVAVVSGPPGAGKTALALQVAHAARPSFPDGQLWVQLDGASARPRDPGEVLGELLRSLGVHGSAIPAGAEERAAMYRSRLAGQRVLLLADDAASAQQVRALMPGTAGNAVLVTSRNSLAGLAGATQLLIDTLAPAEAVTMLTRIVGNQRSGAEPEAIGEMAQACGLMPLALRIAGAKLAARPSWRVSMMVRKLGDERRRLDELKVGDLSVRSGLALSYETLSEQAKRAFCFLGLLGPLDVAEWVIAALLGEPDAADVVTELNDKCLLTAIGVDVTGEPRYRLHDLVRDYAAERLDGDLPQAADAALERAIAGWLQLAHLASSAMPEVGVYPSLPSHSQQKILPAELARRITGRPVAWFNAERLNLLAMTEVACVSERHQLGAQLASCQNEFQYYQSRHDDAKRIWRAVADAAASASDISTIAIARLRLAGAMAFAGFDAEALEGIDTPVSIFEQTGDLDGLALGLYWRSTCEWAVELLEAARRDAERGVAIAEMCGNRRAAILNLRMLGSALSWLGEHKAGIAACEKALGMAVEQGIYFYESQALANLAQAYTKAGQCERAVQLCRRRLILNQEYADVRGEAMALGMLGDAYHGLGHYQKAIQALSQAMQITQDNFMRRHHALCLLKLGYAYEAAGIRKQAVEHFEASRASFAELRLPRYEQRAQQAAQRCISSGGVT